MSKPKEKPIKSEMWRRSHLALYKKLEEELPKLAFKGEPIDSLFYIVSRREGYKDMPIEVIEDILRAHLHPSYFVKDSVRVTLDEQLKIMFGEMNVDPAKFIGELLHWYKEKVFDVAKEIEQQVAAELNC